MDTMVVWTRRRIIRPPFALSLVSACMSLVQYLPTPVCSCSDSKLGRCNEESNFSA